MKKVAVILCGSGFKDGSEIRESVGVLWALARNRASAHCYALNEAQSDVIDCSTGKPMNEKRNQLVESARIARGEVRPLELLKPDQFDALIIPGGFGAAKNLCSFAREGSAGSVNSTLVSILESFYQAKKPIGAVCIAPIILALAFRGKHFELTLGCRSEASSELEKLGHKHIEKSASQWHVDSNNNIFSSPAYMYDNAPLNEIFDGISGMVDALIAAQGK